MLDKLWKQKKRKEKKRKKNREWREKEKKIERENKNGLKWNEMEWKEEFRSTGILNWQIPATSYGSGSLSLSLSFLFFSFDFWFLVGFCCFVFFVSLRIHERREPIVDWIDSAILFLHEQYPIERVVKSQINNRRLMGEVVLDYSS